VTFCVNPHCPVIIPVIENQTIDAGAGFVTIPLDLHVADAFDALPNLTWSTTGATQLTVTIVGHLATVTYPANFIGCEDITFHVIDVVGCEATQTVHFCVRSHCPEIGAVIPGDTVWASETFPTINLNDYVTDPVDPLNTLIWTVTTDANLHVSIDAAHIATITYPPSFTDGCGTSPSR